MTLENQIPPNPELSHSEDESDSIDAFVDRVKQLYAFERTALDDLLELSRDPEAGEKFKDFLGDLAFTASMQNEEFSANIKKMRTRKLTDDEVSRQRELLSQYKETILNEAGIPTELSKSEMEVSQQKIRKLIEAELVKNPDSEPLDILAALGMLQVDKDGNEFFTYPDNLFPPTTDRKWDTYIESVTEWIRLKKIAKAEPHRIKEWNDADGDRSKAHDAAAHDVDKALGLDNLPDSQWDFIKTRELLAKMRDSRFPTEETGEKSVTQRAILQGLMGVHEGLMGVHAIKALRTRTAELHQSD